MTSQRLAGLIRYGLYALALMPLVIFSQFLSPFHFGKMVVFRGAIEILGILYIVLLLQDRRWWIKTDKIFWAISLFTAVFLLTALTGFDRYTSLMGTLERMGGWFSFVHFWGFFVLLKAVMRKKEDWLMLIKISVVVSLLSTLYGFLQKTGLQFIVGSGGRSRIFGTIGNPALFAGYELINVWLALWLTLKREISKNQRIFFAIILTLNLLAVFSTAVRGSILGLVVSFAIFAFLLSRFLGGPAIKLRKAIVFILILMAIGETFLIFNQKADWVRSNGYLARLSDISLSSPTVRTRFWAWQAGIDGWNDSPRTILVGWGPENFNLPFSKHFNPRFYDGPGSETLFDRGHNMFVEVLVTMGLLGFLSYLALFWTIGMALYRLYNSKSPDLIKMGAVFFAGLFAYLIHNFFIFDTSANFLLFFIVVGFISWTDQENSLNQRSDVALKKENSRQKEVPPRPHPAANFVGALLLLVVIFSIYKTSLRPALANYSATRAIVASWNGDHPLAVEKFNQSLGYNAFSAYEVRHRYLQYLMENFSKFTDPQQREELLLSGIEEAKKNIISSDKDYLPYLYISRAYIMLGKDEPGSLYNKLAL